MLGGLGLILALGQYSPINLHYLLWLLPGLSGLRAPGRFTVVVVLAGGMLAAYGLAWLQSQGAARPQPAVRRLVGLVGAALAGLMLCRRRAAVALLVWPVERRSTRFAAGVPVAVAR